jgi:O-antigen ligase
MRQHSKEANMRDWKLTAALLGLASCLVLGALLGGVNVLLVIGGAAAGIVFLWLAFRDPLFFLVAVLFAPQLKAYWPLQRLDQAVDLTVAMLVGLALGLGWRLLKYSARIDKAPRPKFADVPKWPLVGFAVFAGIVAISYSYTPAVSYGGTELLRLLGIGTLMLVAPFVIIRSEQDLRRFVVLFLGAGLILALQMIAHLDDRQSTSATDITRIGAGWLMGMLILLALYYRPFQRPSYNTAQAWVLVPLFSFALIASAARGPIVALLVVLILNLVTSVKMVSRIVLTAALLGLSTYAAFSVFSHIDPSKYNSKVNQIADIFEGKSTTGSAAVRLRFYRQTWAALPTHLFLGGGIGSWSVFYYGADKRGYPHNLLLQIAFEQGLVGVAGLGFFLATMAAVTYKLLHKTGARYAVFPSLVLFCVIVSMFSGDLDDNRILWYWTGVTLAVCAIIRFRSGDWRPTRFMFRREIDTSVPSLSSANAEGRLSSAT